jgi:predicted dehydrogenase
MEMEEARSKLLRVGIIGTGWGVKVQVPAFRKAGWEVTALSGRDEAKLKQFGGELGIAFVTTDHHALITHPDVDLVSIVLPPHTHAELTVAALKAGKHVLCDKPTALNAQEALIMHQTALEHPKQLSLLDFELRFLPTWQKAREVIQSGQLGKVYSITGEFFTKFGISPDYYWWWDKKHGGGLLGAVGTHVIDNISWILGSRMQAVNATLHTLVKEREETVDGEKKKREVTADDSVVMQLRFENGTVGNISLQMYGHGYKDKRRKEISFLCEKGTLSIDVGRGDLDVYNTNDEKVIALEREQLLELPFLNNPFGHGTILFAQAIAETLRAAESGSTAKLEVPLAATLEDGLYVQTVIDACRRSNELGTWANL